MSNLERAVYVLQARKAAIGDGTEVRRLLPQRNLRTVARRDGTPAGRTVPYHPRAVRGYPESSPVFVLGGEPFGERLLMWWNFVARTAEEIVAARADWVAGRFAPVRACDLAPLPVPELPVGRLRPK